MDSTGHIDRDALSDLVARSQPGFEPQAPEGSAGKTHGRDWLSFSWTALLVAYAAAAVPLIGGAIVQAL
jgi:hypothetical protein